MSRLDFGPVSTQAERNTHDGMGTNGFSMINTSPFLSDVWLQPHENV